MQTLSKRVSLAKIDVSFDHLQKLLQNQSEFTAEHISFPFCHIKLSIWQRSPRERGVASVTAEHRANTNPGPVRLLASRSDEYGWLSNITQPLLSAEPHRWTPRPRGDGGHRAERRLDTVLPLILFMGLEGERMTPGVIRTVGTGVIWTNRECDDCGSWHKHRLWSWRDNAARARPNSLRHYKRVSCDQAGEWRHVSIGAVHKTQIIKTSSSCGVSL